MPLPLLVPAFALIMASLAPAARADMDHAAEARRAAQRQEAAHQAAQQKSRDEATKNAAMARGYRGMLIRHEKVSAPSISPSQGRSLMT